MLTTIGTNNNRIEQMNKEFTDLQTRLYKVERFLDRHNHLMEFIRTLLALIVLTLQFYILSRL